MTVYSGRVPPKTYSSGISFGSLAAVPDVFDPADVDYAILQAEETMHALYLLGHWPVDPYDPIQGGALAHQWGPSLVEAYRKWATQKGLDPSFRIATKEEMGPEWVDYAPSTFAVVVTLTADTLVKEAYESSPDIVNEEELGVDVEDGVVRFREEEKVEGRIPLLWTVVLGSIGIAGLAWVVARSKR